MLYLGGKSADTNQKIAEMIGKQTVANVSVNDSRGNNPTYTHNYGLIERDLMPVSYTHLDVYKRQAYHSVNVLQETTFARDSFFAN